jgi:hypothetical protein
MTDTLIAGFWRELAACQNADPNLFYPESMEDEAAWAARGICGACPVADVCLQDALDSNERFGIRGGLSPKQRSNLLKGRTPKKVRKPPTGRTRATKRTHCKAGHEFTPDNTRIYQGKRYCRACIRNRKRAAYAARRQAVAA